MHYAVFKVGWSFSGDTTVFFYVWQPANIEDTCVLAGYNNPKKANIPSIDPFEDVDFFLVKILRFVMPLRTWLPLFSGACSIAKRAKTTIRFIISCLEQ